MLRESYGVSSQPIFQFNGRTGLNWINVKTWKTIGIQYPGLDPRPRGRDYRIVRLRQPPPSLNLPLSTR
jgi:hypothetical protein